MSVGTAASTRLDVTLEVGAVTDTITVSEQTSLLKTESGEMSPHAGHQGRYRFARLLPSAAGTRTFAIPCSRLSSSPARRYRTEMAVVVNGMPANSQSIRIEGQDSTGNIWKIAQQNSQAGVDAIQEVAIQTSNFAAEFGQAAGGYFNYTMKSGTNAFHGGAYDYLVNEASECRSALYRPLRSRRALLHRLPTPGSIFATACAATTTVSRSADRFGYPKLYDGRNKTFLLLQLRTIPHTPTLTSTGLATVPTAAYRSGDFSTALCSSYTGGGLDGTGGTCTPI